MSDYPSSLFNSFHAIKKKKSFFLFLVPSERFTYRLSESDLGFVCFKFMHLLSHQQLEAAFRDFRINELNEKTSVFIRDFSVVTSV